ncbi:MAG TPA: hypothetical protein VI215_13355 [Bacteroidota bacterium]
MAGIVLGLLIAVGAGKRTRRPAIGAYLFLLALAVVQAGVVLFDMFTRQLPSP